MFSKIAVFALTLAFSLNSSSAKPSPTCTSKYENCCLTTGVCPSSSCVSSLNYPNDAKAHCDKDCQAKTDCISIVPGCDASGDLHCLGKIKCVFGTNCDGKKDNDYCLYDGNSKNYKICSRNTGGVGDPEFTGLQLQNFQVHGVPDEFFNIITTSTLQVNANFHYMSIGKSDLNHTIGWTHPGTYMNKFGIMIGGDYKIELISHSHNEGMYIEINSESLGVDEPYFLDSDNESVYRQDKNVVIITTTEFIITIINADMFFNLEVALVDQKIVEVGKKFLKIGDSLCNKPRGGENSPIRLEVLKHYPDLQMHGLVGQTWKNIDYCGNMFEGDITDYMTGGMYGTNFVYNYFVNGTVV